jgi:hypothetical protein
VAGSRSGTGGRCTPRKGGATLRPDQRGWITSPQAFNGYSFRILTKQGDTAKGGAKNYIVNGKMTGGFAILAYPAEYQNSGIMSFLVGTDGTVYEKDLGPMTDDTAVAMTEYNLSGWKPVNDQGSRE